MEAAMAPLAEQQDKVVEWRKEELIRVGYPLSLAADLANCTDVDLHLACDLVSRGCDPQTACHILM